MKTITFPQVGGEPARSEPDLTRYAWLAIGTAAATISLKAGAYLVTGSVGLLSDAAESVVNLVAAIVALIALNVAARPADKDHQYGHGKAEYFSAGLEGLMIFVASGAILVSAIQRLMHPVALEHVGIGLGVALVATAINGVVGMLLIRTGNRRRSATLTADGKHLMTDVWTSVGVVIGVSLVAITDVERLDPIIALIVGLNIMVTGYRLVSQSVRSLLDAALPDEDLSTLNTVLNELRSGEIDFSQIRTRESGRFRFVALRMFVPDTWTVQRAHDKADEIEEAIQHALPDTTVQIQLEPHSERANHA